MYSRFNPVNLDILLLAIYSRFNPVNLDILLLAIYSRFNPVNLDLSDILLQTSSVRNQVKHCM